MYGGTPVGNESRCTTCVNARIIEGYAESERMVFCDAMYPATRIPFNVRQCTMYEDNRLPDYEKLKHIAWDIRARQDGARSGFVLASDLARESDDEETAPVAFPTVNRNE